MNKSKLALEAVLLFHSGGPWDMKSQTDWQAACRELLGSASSSDERFGRGTGWEATARVLCDMVRAALKEEA